MYDGLVLYIEEADKDYLAILINPKFGDQPGTVSFVAVFEAGQLQIVEEPEVFSNGEIVVRRRIRMRLRACISARKRSQVTRDTVRIYVRNIEEKATYTGQTVGLFTARQGYLPDKFLEHRPRLLNHCLECQPQLLRRPRPSRDNRSHRGKRFISVKGSVIWLVDCSFLSRVIRSTGFGDIVASLAFPEIGIVSPWSFRIMAIYQA